MEESTMKRIATVILVVVMSALGGTAFAEGTCTTGNFAVVDLPTSIYSYPEPCSAIVLPANSLAHFKVDNFPLAVKFGDTKVVVTEMTFRIGDRHEEFTLRSLERLEFPFRANYKLDIVDVPKHLRGGESALWYEIKEAGSLGRQVAFLANYPTQVLVPRGSTVRILSDAKVVARYDGQERECLPDEIVEFEGHPGVDLIEIRGLDRDGSATIGIRTRKVATLMGSAPKETKSAPKKGKKK